MDRDPPGPIPQSARFEVQQAVLPGSRNARELPYAIRSFARKAGPCLAIHQETPTAGVGAGDGIKDIAVGAPGASGSSLAQLCSGLGTAFLALLVLLWLAVTAVGSLAGVPR
ncbi:hypothetical protein [Streptomyces canus]|uniref:hypothetical protein n=1 Tax=Streptomyces canus TaxID=58343 RepID=UPI002E349B1F|nr:hypothetical protein [Streptomyces canus]